MPSWHFTSRPADLPIEQIRQRIYHANMAQKMEMIHGKIFWDARSASTSLASCLSAWAPRKRSALSSSTEPIQTRRLEIQPSHPSRRIHQNAGP